MFRNPTRSLTPGLFVRLRLPGTAATAALLIQDRAVGTDLDKRFVCVVDQGSHRRVPAGNARPARRRLRVVRSGPAGERSWSTACSASPGHEVDPSTSVMDPSRAEAEPPAAPAGRVDGK